MADSEVLTSIPSYDEILNFKKTELLELARHLSISCSHNLTKADIRSNIFAALGRVPSDHGSVNGDIESEDEDTSEIKALKLKLKIEQEISRRERLRYLQESKPVSPSTDSFDINKVVRLVPPFKESDVDSYFLHFERVAQIMKWPKNIWPMLLQSVLVGKAQEAYVTLSLEESSDYEIVKSRILRAFEKVPEAYRYRFRSLKKSESMTYSDLAHSKEVAFDRWCRSMMVDNFEQLRELILIEEFKQCLPEDMKTFIEDKDPDDYKAWIMLSEEYAISRKRSNKERKSTFNHADQGASKMKQSDNRPVRNPFNGSTRPVTCHYCKKTGHTISECFKLKRKKEEEKNSVNTVDSKDVLASPKGDFLPFTFEGTVSLDNKNEVPVTILRDTGAIRSFILSNVLPLSENSATGDIIDTEGFWGTGTVKLHKININCELVSGPVVVGVTDHIPARGITLLLGNDLAGSKIRKGVSVDINDSPISEEKRKNVPCGVITRSQALKRTEDADNYTPNSEGSESNNTNELIAAQERDNEIKKLFDIAVSEREIKTVPRGYYFKESGLLMRKWRDPRVPANEEWSVFHQIVVPKKFRGEILRLGHEVPMAGHLGIRKTFDKVTRHFYWPGIRSDITAFCRRCHICQVSGKPNQVIPKSPLRPLPIVESAFSRIIIDCVGPLPKTRAGNQYLLTIMCASTRFPEAIPLKRITAVQIADSLLKFSRLLDSLRKYNQTRAQISCRACFSKS